MKIGLLVFVHNEGDAIDPFLCSLAVQKNKPDFIMFYGNRPDNRTWIKIQNAETLLKQFYNLDILIEKTNINIERGGAYYNGYSKMYQMCQTDIIVGLGVRNIPSINTFDWIDQEFKKFKHKYGMVSIALYNEFNNYMESYGHLLCNDASCLDNYHHENVNNKKKWLGLGWPCLGIGAFSKSIFESILPDPSFEVGGYCEDFIIQCTYKIGVENLERPTITSPFSIPQDAWCRRNNGNGDTDKWWKETFSRIRLLKRYWEDPKKEILKIDDPEKRTILDNIYPKIREESMLAERSELERKRIKEFINSMPPRPQYNQSIKPED